ncbi:hypothetical protein FGW37_04405 [Streptomyces rectiverticillatus]|uniref:hypothetical protein n=1 Tax=Streptomyces rectiverticillatus TaxID=173860 RepID=UPI0015C36BC3|nr:hypothetical protein [Streptomyces rectiverticillatus]QLE70947.1 hypothetical protein FGW37_04405 [Streptomyces rectiverticillatus]
MTRLPVSSEWDRLGHARNLRTVHGAAGHHAGSRLSPDPQGAEWHTRQWLVDQQLCDEAARISNSSHVFGHLAAYAYPSAGEEVLHVAADWMTWLYALDDGFVDESRPSPVTVTTQTAALLRVMDGGPAATPLARARAWPCASRHRRTTPASLS